MKQHEFESDHDVANEAPRVHPVDHLDLPCLVGVSSPLCGNNRRNKRTEINRPGQSQAVLLAGALLSGGAGKGPVGTRNHGLCATHNPKVGGSNPSPATNADFRNPALRPGFCSSQPELRSPAEHFAGIACL